MLSGDATTETPAGAELRATPAGPPAPTPQREVWIDTFKVRAGRTVVSVERHTTSGVEGDRDQDRWRVVAPKWADHIGPDRWFDDHIAAQQFAARMAELLDKQRASWDEAMQTIRGAWVR